MDLIYDSPPSLIELLALRHLLGLGPRPTPEGSETARPVASGHAGVPALLDIAAVDLALTGPALGADGYKRADTSERTAQVETDRWGTWWNANVRVWAYSPPPRVLFEATNSGTSTPEIDAWLAEFEGDTRLRSAALTSIGADADAVGEWLLRQVQRVVPRGEVNRAAQKEAAERFGQVVQVQAELASDLRVGVLPVEEWFAYVGPGALLISEVLASDPHRYREVLTARPHS